MFKSIVRSSVALFAAALLALPLVSCGNGSSSSGTQAPSAPAANNVNYKCSGCGKTGSAAASVAAPSC